METGRKATGWMAEQGLMRVTHCMIRLMKKQQAAVVLGETSLTLRRNSPAVADDTDANEKRVQRLARGLHSLTERALSTGTWNLFSPICREQMPPGAQAWDVSQG